MQAARDAIDGRGELSAVRRADHLTVLWFIAEAENVAVDLLRAYIQKEKLMQSELYRSIFAEGERKGLQQAIMDLCEILSIELTPERRAQIEQLDPAQLSQIRTHLKSARAWPSARP